MPQFYVFCSQDLHILHQFFLVRNKTSRAYSLVDYLIICSGKLMWFSGENETAFTIGVSLFWQCKLFLCCHWIECSNFRPAEHSYSRLLSWQLSLKQNLFCCLLLWLSWLMAFFLFCTILSWSTRSLTWFSVSLSQKSWNEHESRMNSHLNWLYTCNPLGWLREIYQTSHLSLQLLVYLLKEWASGIVVLFLYNMPGLNSFFLTVFLFHFIEVESKHKIPQCLIRMRDHRLLWTIELKLSIAVLKVSPGG